MNTYFIEGDEVNTNTYFIEGDEVGYISTEDTPNYGFFMPVYSSSSEDELIELCAELNELAGDAE